ncbi:hypothetical protein BU26DRAFT_603782 [Trematosphaeria pertusa]|uniref:Uncharacterized protein n=1 Tax=Trematosphaeria pertusa TaxID=390896 RepID=A0A6A6IM79_9PLEO|nr:uncharacterized protein BU26DRAFT_603782 [Trematosphaeria pertusa]KAF2251339.1 hypothetical protein BU26DRAFT_603782 [Trematosphaeria pertusa]
MSYTNFRGLLTALDGYIDELSPYTVDLNNTLFPRLPLELRELIYRYIAHPPHQRGPRRTYVSRHAGGALPPWRPLWLPTICSVNWATWIEAGLYVIRSTEFEIMYPDNLDYFAKFLDTFPGEQGWTAVRRLYFTLFDRNGVFHAKRNGYIDFMHRCTGLTEVTLKFNVRKLLDKQTVLLPYVALAHMNISQSAGFLTLDEVTAMHGLEAIFEVSSLNKVYIDVFPRIYLHAEGLADGVLMDGMELIEELAEWMREGFRRRGRSAAVVVREVRTEGLTWDSLWFI